MKKPSIYVISLLVALASAGAQNQPSASLEAYSSFGWSELEASTPGGETVQETLIRKRLDSRLSSMGYRSDASSPDFFVTTHLVGESPSITLVIDIIDAESGLLVWRSLDSDASGRSLWKARFSNYETYVWKSIPGLEEAPIYAVSDVLLRDAIREELTIRGYEHTSWSEADMGLAYHVVGEGADARKPMTGTLVVELLSRDTNELLWQARTSAIVSNPEDREELVRSVVRELFLELQTRGATLMPFAK